MKGGARRVLEFYYGDKGTCFRIVWAAYSSLGIVSILSPWLHLRRSLALGSSPVAIKRYLYTTGPTTRYTEVYLEWKSWK